MAQSIFVKVAKLGGRVSEVSLEEGTTVQDAITASGLEQGQLKARLNGEATTLGIEVEDGDVITLVPQTIKGGTV